MKRFFLTACLSILLSAALTAQEGQPQHLLDGTSMDYYYQNGSAVHATFEAGQFQFEWFLGPNAGATGSCAYNSRKIGEKRYLVGFSFDPSKAYVTIAFNFNENVFATSGWLGAGTEEELFLFEAGVIEKLKLKEN
ncbi:hypothetical protein [Robiginitalea sp. SC105]|uniref:hypothetical protein n=1 Tax=Robiginitalea sp. SC105 TaxID=2762332 RepID=UPI00163B39C1|nr:hypothetical protein [Robiginitalea sp. SC105]MBC2837747.1 hypothetical protein [Robiginitalea sp. SC105]